MRLLFVNSAWTHGWGGGEKWTVEAAAWFAQHRHETQVVGRPGSRLVAAATRQDLPTAETCFGGDFSPWAVGRAKRIIRRFRPDLIVVNFNKEAWQFGWAARSAGIPVVARHGFPLLRNAVHHRYLLTRILTHVVANAGGIRNLYEARGLPVEHVSVIHNGTRIVPQKRGLLRRRLGITENERLVLAAGRLEPQKRFDRFIEIAARVLAGRSNVRFVIAGEGPLHDDLSALIRARSLEQRVALAGFVENAAELMGDADVLVLTSDEEGTPNVLLEAMAAEVACVSFAVGSVPEILNGDLSALLIEPGDIQTMSARVGALLDDAETRATVSQQCRQRIEAEFLIETSMRRFEELFEKCGHH